MIQFLYFNMLKQTISYNQASAKLQVEGLPDNSSGHTEQTIGIISSFKLQLLGAPDLEGKKEHLVSLMSVLLPYARHLISGTSSSFISPSSPISINPLNGRHQLILRSSKPDIKPLELILDHAELSDLIRCLDDLRTDPRVKIQWELSNNIRFRRIDIPLVRPVSKNLIAPLIAALTLSLSTFLLLMIQIPNPEESTDIRSQDRSLLNK